MRKTIDVTIEAEGRDHGKTFHITEMPAARAEKWATRAILALMESGLDIPAGIARSGMAGVGQLAHLIGRIRFPELEPLMDEVMGCVEYVPDSARPEIKRAIGVAGAEDIEEVETYQFLRGKALELHTSFTLAATVLTLIAVASTMKTSSIIPTSRSRSGSSSPVRLRSRRSAN